MDTMGGDQNHFSWSNKSHDYNSIKCKLSSPKGTTLFNKQGVQHFLFDSTFLFLPP